MRQILNTLYVMTQGSYVHLDHETVKVEVDKVVQLQVPLQHLGGICVIGNVLISPFLMGRCAEEGRSVVILDRHAEFLCRIVGPVGGNVLLRQSQYEAVHDDARSALIARAMVAGKVRNSRQVLLRGRREAEDESEAIALQKAADGLGNVLHRLKDESRVDVIRGLEGEAAVHYFGVFDRMIKPESRGPFLLRKRSRRPPLDPINGLISFLYTLLLHDCISALESVGLDPQMGFLHDLRPGRPSLGLDLMEEFRAAMADRLALTLVNRKQITERDFEIRPGGATYLNDSGRKTVVVAYQKRKQEELRHPVLEEQVAYGLLPHVQGRLLARHLRGDAESYLPMLFS